MTIKRYSKEDLPVWDAFVRKSRNGTFLFERAYMDYHKDRFADHSLLYYNDKNKLIALLPGNAVGSLYSSHSGLTYGGFVLAPHTRAVEVLNLFSATREYLKSEGFAKWIYKQVPSIYHKSPSEDDEYALWKNGAELVSCNLSTTANLHADFRKMIDPDKERKKVRALQDGFVVKETDDFSSYWPIVENLLQNKYGTKPVHSLEEITLLHNLFPKQIRCFVAIADEKVEAGVVVYETDEVVHAQYSDTTEYGQAKGAIILIYKYLIDYYQSNRPDIRYFDFGTSNEDGGKYLNTTLNSFKEDFGGRGVAYKTYQITL